MLEVQSFKKLPKKLLIYLLLTFYKLFFYCQYWILKNKISIRHSNAKPEKVLGNNAFPLD